jgi:hypothetical protein
MASPPTPSLFPHIRHPQKRALLLAYTTSLRITEACRQAKVGRQTHYLWMRKDPAYVEAFAVAKQMACDYLEDVAIERATEGPHPSDTLLIFLLKGAMPHKYRDNAPHVQVEQPVAITFEHRLREANERSARLRREG